MRVNRAFLDSFLPLDGLRLDPAEREAVYAGVARAVAAQARLAPLHLRLPIEVLGLCFAVWLGLGRGLGLGAAGSAAAWERLGDPFRALTRLQRSLALMAFADDPRVAPLLHRP